MSMGWRFRSSRWVRPHLIRDWAGRTPCCCAAGETVQLAIKFPPYEDPLTPYMYHCHLMWHEDVGMMAQFTVVDPDQVDSAPRDLEVDHDHMAAGHDHG